MAGTIFAAAAGKRIWPSNCNQSPACRGDSRQPTKGWRPPVPRARNGHRSDMFQSQRQDKSPAKPAATMACVCSWGAGMGSEFARALLAQPAGGAKTKSPARAAPPTRRPAVGHDLDGHACRKVEEAQRVTEGGRPRRRGERGRARARGGPRPLATGSPHRHAGLRRSGRPRRRPAGGQAGRARGPRAPPGLGPQAGWPAPGGHPPAPTAGRGRALGPRGRVLAVAAGESFSVRGTPRKSSLKTATTETNSPSEQIDDDGAINSLTIRIFLFQQLISYFP